MDEFKLGVRLIGALAIVVALLAVRNEVIQSSAAPVSCNVNRCT